MILKGRNVNELFYEGMHLLDECGEQSDSRAGRVCVVPFPVVSLYEKPQERVLFCPLRDANPFFHLMESLWMLAGRDDAAFLDRYIKDFGSRFADDGVIHGAYGHRWRTALGFDQLKAVVDKLRANPDDRQAVIQMWDARPSHLHQDFGVGCDDLRGAWRDRPCNTHIYLRVRREHRYAPAPILGATDMTGTRYEYSVLDLTVLCRSNDAVWGAHGANAVHFSVLQEYLAGRIGVGVGTMYQFSNNYHGYVDALERLGPPETLGGDDPYANSEVQSLPMGSDWTTWDTDLREFMTWHDGGARDPHGLETTFKNTWFRDVAVPVARANSLRRDGDWTGAFAAAEQIAAPDWRRACLEWMRRRAK